MHIANERRQRDLLVCEGTDSGCIRLRRRHLDFRERRSIKRKLVAERDVQLE